MRLEIEWSTKQLGSIILYGRLVKLDETNWISNNYCKAISPIIFKFFSKRAATLYFRSLCIQGWTEDFVIEGALRYIIQWQYGRDRAHQDCERRTFLGSFGCTLLRENVCDWSSLRCNLVHSGRLNLANAWNPYWTCNAEIFNKPQKRGPGPPCGPPLNLPLVFTLKECRYIP